MAYNMPRKSRERRLRARYRRKIWVAAIIMLIIGLVLGFVASIIGAQKSDSFAKLFKAPSSKQDLVIQEPDVDDDEDEDGAWLDEPTQQPLAAITPTAMPELTEAPTAVPTEVPTEAPTAAPAEVVPAPTFVNDAQTPEPEVEQQPAIVAATLGEGDKTVVKLSLPEFTQEPTEAPTAEPTEAPTAEPTEAPTAEPTEAPTAEPTEAPTAEPTEAPTAEPTEAPTAEPTEAPTPEPTEEPVQEPAKTTTVAYGEAYNVKTEILSDGTKRLNTDSTSFETLDLTIQINAYKGPDYFEREYAKSYNLQGNEAVAEFTVTLNGYTGMAEIRPQDVLDITFRGEDESVSVQGYQIIDREIGGKPEVAILPDEPKTIYKRYAYNADQGHMAYMVVTAFVNGQKQTYLFDLRQPVTEEQKKAEQSGGTYDDQAPYTVGSKGEGVKKLQATLISKKLLSGQPDGKFGKYTAEAVKIMQKRYGMEVTGIADQAFLDKLYNDN